MTSDDRPAARTRMDHVLACVDHARNPRTQTQPDDDEHDGDEPDQRSELVGDLREHGLLTVRTGRL